MIIIRLAGGLGNQIFQLGAGLLIASKNGCTTILLDDSALSSYDVKRTNELENFFDFNQLNTKVVFQNSFLSKLRIPKIAPYKFSKYPFIGDNNFQKLLNNSNQGFSLVDGYFQWVLTQENYDQIFAILKLLFKDQSIQDNTNNTCVVHIRGGDFVKLGWNSITPASYYLDAIKYMITHQNIEKFIIVTDDIEYSNVILKDVSCQFEFKCSNMLEDFYTIASYSYRILSSSTFALCSSTLGNNHNGCIIAPEYWFPNQKRVIFIPNEIRL